MTSVTPGEILARAADRIEQLGWCQEVTALNSEGVEVDIAATDAVRWCAAGAINLEVERVFPRKPLGPNVAVHTLYEDACALCGGDDKLVDLNDHESSTALTMASFLREAAKDWKLLP